MKVNLTKKHIEALEATVAILKANGKLAKGKEKAEIRQNEVTLSDILVRHDNRTEKDY